MEAATHAMLECSIQGYSFRRLENTAEYVKAGKELRNCLGRWWFGGNVYGIVKKNKYVAAVEIDGKVIIQACTLRNGDISNDKNLQKVFNMWKEKNMLVVVDEK